MSNKKNKYGICNLSTIPVRKNSSSTSELVTQLIFGELYTITKQIKKWYYIKIQDDSYCGWVNYSQINIISKIDFDKLKLRKPEFSINVTDFIYKDSEPTIITIGSTISSCMYLNYTFKEKSSEKIKKNDIIGTAMKFLNIPYLWGGKTALGIDCSGFTQMVYKISNIKINRDASQQAKQGKLISKEKIKPGNLAFFGESDKSITHVGIMLNKTNIIHAFGKVRIDKINSKGILNSDSESITHELICFRNY
ncbi:MAG: C40 family peptidase [Flavobacteriales bacterium]|jgi:hypothetical protein|tara:strand:+ start:2553 stop:3305 length:753 start_codon:yes stop_codon:yes gene_type:complete